MGAIGAAVAGGVASAAVGSGISALTGSKQSGAISQGQQQANEAVQPWVTTGTSANTLQANLLGLNGQDAADTAVKSFQASPGYQYSVTEGLKGVDAGAAAKGLLRSGATLKAEQTLGTNLADQEFGNYMTRLNGLSTLGQNSATGQAGTDTSAAGQQASIYGNVGKTVGDAASGVAGTAVNSLFSSGTPTPGANSTGSGGNLDPYTGLSYMNA